MDYTQIIISISSAIAVIISLTRILGKKFDKIDEQFNKIDEQFKEVRKDISVLNGKISRIEGYLQLNDDWPKHSYNPRKRKKQRK